MFQENTFPTTCGGVVWSGVYAKDYSGQAREITPKEIKHHLELLRKRGQSVVMVVLTSFQMKTFGDAFLGGGFKIALTYHNTRHPERDPRDKTEDTVLLVAPTVPDEEREKESRLSNKVHPTRAIERQQERNKEVAEENATHAIRRKAWLKAKFDRNDAWTPEPCFCDLCHKERGGK